jgi:CubicO group peptidase (beta-lactamase class C family)
MASGLKWSEAYSPLKMLESDVIQMLYRYDAAAARPLEKTLGWTAGKEWCYSSGDTNLLQLSLRRSFASDEEYWTYPARVLFDKLRASSAVMEVDRNGTFVGSSFSYLTARDWARFGLLYLRGGVWIDGDRILPQGWTDFSAALFPESAGMYAGHFWKKSLFKLVPCHIDAEHVQNRINTETPLWPEDAYLASGYAGQMVIVVPSKDLVIVRLGYTPTGMDFSPYPLMLEVIKALEQN